MARETPAPPGRARAGLTLVIVLGKGEGAGAEREALRMEKGSKDCKDMRDAEASEHAEMWKRSPKFRAAVEKRVKGTGARKAMGKR